MWSSHVQILCVLLKCQQLVHVVFVVIKKQSKMKGSVRLSMILQLLFIFFALSETRPDNVKDIREEVELKTDESSKEERKVEPTAEFFLCPSNVGTFSEGPNRQHYFVCHKLGSRPLLKKCPLGQTYWAKKQICRSMGTSETGARVRRSLGTSGEKLSDLETIVEPVLGRSVYLGSLFDARSNTIRDADSFWSSETVEKKKRSHNAMSSHLSFSDPQTSFERVSRSKLRRETQLEVLSGLVELGGSASYLKEDVNSINTMSYTMSSHYTTRTSTMPTTTPQDFPHLCNSIGGAATHVVTSLKYGMEAHVTLVKTLNKGDTKEDVFVKLRQAARNIPALARGGKITEMWNFLQSPKEFSNGLYVRMRSDVILKVQPTRYDGIVEVFSDLTQHLGQPPLYTHSKEMRMTLTPITRFCNVTPPLFHMSDSVLQLATTTLGSLEQNMLSLEYLSATSDYMKTIIGPIKQALDTLGNTMKRDLAKIIPKVKGGEDDMGEKDVVKILNRFDDDHQIHLKQFVLKITTEMATLDQIMSWSELETSGVKVIETTDELAESEKLLLLTKPTVVLVQFNVLTSPSLVKEYLVGSTTPGPFWTSDDVIIAKMGLLLKSYVEFASVNRDENVGFFFRKNFVNDNKTIQVFAQKDGSIFTDHFEIPQRPSALRNVASKFGSISFEVTKPVNKWVTAFEVIQQSQGGITKTIKLNFSRDDRYEIKGLEANALYYFTVRYVTQVGFSRPSPRVGVTTRVTSPPESLRIDQVQEKSFRIVWEPPSQLGNGVKVSNYEVSVTFEAPGSGQFEEQVLMKTPPSPLRTTQSPTIQRVYGYCPNVLTTTACRANAEAMGIGYSSTYSSIRPYGCFLDTINYHVQHMHFNDYSRNRYRSYCSKTYVCQCSSSYPTTPHPPTWRGPNWGDPTSSPTGAPMTLFRNIRFPTPIKGEDENGTFIGGHVEVQYNGIWATICDDYFGDAEASVVCSMGGLGSGLYAGGRHKQVNAAQTSVIGFDNVQCNGTESDIWYCNHSGWRSHDCHPSENVGIKCYIDVGTTKAPTTAAPEQPVRPEEPESTEWVVTDTTPRFDGSTVVRSRSVRGTSVIFTGTRAATKYEVTVRAITETKNDTENVGGETSRVNIVTSPSAPHQPILVNQSYHFIRITWSAPSAIFPGDHVAGYVVKTDLLDEHGNVVKGRGLVHNVGNKTSHLVPHLEADRLYSVSVMVITAQGARSSYSTSLVVQTLSTKSVGNGESLKEMMHVEIEKSLYEGRIRSELEAQRRNDSKVMQRMDERVELCGKGISSLQQSLSNTSSRVDVLEMKVSNSAQQHSNDNISEGVVASGRWNMTDINRRITELANDNSHAFLFKYPKYGYELIGFGYYGRQSGSATTKNNVSPIECLEYCSQIGGRVSGAGIWYQLSARRCGCTSGDTGHTHAPEYLHFRRF